MHHFLAVSALLIASAISLSAQSVGNPRPGFPHDTINIHVQKASSGPKLCDGGHSLFLRYGADMKIPNNTLIHLTMIDWNQVDNDNDGLFDEDGPDGIDNDGNNGIDEDGVEPGANTTALDCDSYGDNLIALQIRDTDPRPGVVSVQEWFMRLVGKPETNFAFTSYANQKVSCTLLSDNGTLDPADDVYQCVSVVGTVADWIQLMSYNLAANDCVKQVKLGGKNPEKGGGKTPFCDVTDGFEVDVDTDKPLDGIPNLLDQFVFTISCFDDPATAHDETLNASSCPLSSVIWEIDEEGTTPKAHVQIFVSHTGSASVKTGRILNGNQ